MALDLVSPLEEIISIVAGLEGVHQVYAGIPKGVSKQLVAFVSLGGQAISDKASGGLVERTVRYRVMFGYGVDGIPEDAEVALATIVDRFLVAIYAARQSWAQTPGTFGTIRSVDPSPADDPAYALWPGHEYRLYPITVSVAQRMVA